MAPEESSVGKEVNRVEGHAKVTGSALYSADFHFPNLAYAALVQSEIPNGRVEAESLRTSAERASRAPGVLFVLTPLNCPPLNVLSRDLTFDLPLERRPPLSDLSVQHVGQHLAMVVANSPENATDGVSLFSLEYVEAAPQLSAEEVLSQPVPADEKNGQIRHGSYLPDHFVKLTEEKLQDHRGPAEASPSTFQVDSTYTTPVNAHYPIELASTIAFWEEGKLTVHDSTRWIAGERKALAGYLGIPEADIRILSPLVGGAFGSKSFLWMHVALTAVAARELQRPVKLVLTRDQMFSSTGHRPRTKQRIQLSAFEGGLIEGSEHHTLTETSTVAHFCEPAGLSTRFLYHSPRLAVSHQVARINAPTPCFMRGPGEAPGLFALESAMDELAYSAGMDPVQLRVLNHADIDQTNGKTWSTKHLLECYEQGRKKFGWEKRTMAPRSMTRDGVQIGWGMATATYPGRRMPAGCRVITNVERGVEFASATHEVGNGVRTVMSQVAADACGLPMERVSFASGDSFFPDAPYSGASQTTATVGSAVYKAAMEWQQRVKQLVISDAASPFHSHDPAALTITAGVVHSADGFSVGLWELLRTFDTTTVEHALTFDVQSDAGDQEKFAFQSFGAHFCEVEVDEEIGRATVTKWVAVFDCGRVLNPKLARNQIMGGITFGLGMALLEQVPYDAKTSLLIGEYYLPTHADRPDFDISFIDKPDYALDPIGVRGIGEIGACGVPAAIANAIFHATGKRLRDLPIMLEQLMKPFPESTPHMEAV
ncbi:xanthine dehydrogenase YagR molybdenum-binding subunit [Bryocella elongata]|uniref:Xanthine dehydrogenase YagR molybdenum-binding subunit n=1 Tax=Bryocella elongata TaxID=863522 RepID=A0A1H5T355_9BACT|nr:xanthine dehydrogenase family protein molybdopterin-binding subunit [Bryocella elongata]SEF57233.1 xanthine dehydrogenase YagR molybdenum-binding subunit [Bryocella elongata]